MKAAKPNLYSEDVAGRDRGVGAEKKMSSVVLQFLQRRAGKESESEAFIAVFGKAGLTEDLDVAFFDSQVLGVEYDHRGVGQRLQSHRHVSAAFTNG